MQLSSALVLIPACASGSSECAVCCIQARLWEGAVCLIVLANTHGSLNSVAAPVMPDCCFNTTALFPHSHVCTRLSAV